jgi:tungstate transport system ATP-binding protein
MSLELVASDIAKKYDGGQVLQECSFSFRECGLYVLMGPNGSGKSTFLRICALLEEPDRGEVRFNRNGNPIDKDIRLKRRITLLLPKIGVFNSTVFGNVAYGLKVRGLQRDKIGERVGKALDFVGLNGKRNQKALTLSSGETQRLGIARAMAIEPEIFFLDEPTASIDHKNTGIVEDILLRFKADKKTIVVMTTHDMAQAERLADTILIMQNGTLITQSA